LSRVSKLHTVPYFWWLFAIALLLSGCASHDRNDGDNNSAALNAFGPLTHDSQWYLSHINESAPENRFALQVLAARRLIADGDTSQANAVQQQLAKEASTPRQKVALRLLNALQLGKQGQSSKALNRIAGVDLRPLDSNTVQFYYRLQSDLLLKTSQKTAAANSLISLDAYLNGDASSKNQQQIWQLLQDSDTATLKTYVNAANRMKREKAAGWFELAQLSKTPQDQIKRFTDWQKRHPEHPATALFTPVDAPAQPTIAEDNHGITSTTQIQKIAVLLPLSGKLAGPANALTTGLDQANLATGNKLAISYYDENSQPMPELLARAEKDGAQLIVGPLQKNKVEQLVASHASVPVLALNQLEGQPAADNLYYFSLSPEAEAAQIAQKIHEDGMQHPLLLLPPNALGERTASGFNSYWKSLNIGDADIAKFRSRDELLSLLRQKLGGKGGSLQAGQVQSLGDDPANDPKRVDAIYMLASAFEASNIKSSVDMMLGDSTVRPAYYLGSKSNNSGLKPDVALALNGMQLGDMPWMLNRNPDEFAKATTALPQASGDQLRLYAMGHDVGSLIHQLSELRKNAEMTMNGLTGVIHVTTDGVIIRDLIWTRYSNGQLSNAPAAPQPATPQPVQ
jgi:outer membrane PBP1 activator LpoA protein